MGRFRNAGEGEQTVCILLLYIFYYVLTCRLWCRLKLKALHRFTSTATAVEEITAIQEGKMGKGLKKFLSDEVVGKGKNKESLFVADKNLGAFEI
jgi:hypothetical protein